MESLLAAGDLESVRRRGDHVVPELIACLDSESSTVRVNAAQALGLRGGAAATAVPALLRAMEAPETRNDLAFSIVSLGRDGLPHLVDGLSAEDAGVRAAAAEVLATGGYGTLAEPAVAPLIRILESDAPDAVKTHAVMALAATGVGAEPALPLLERLAASASGALKTQAAGAVRRIRDARKPGMLTPSRGTPPPDDEEEQDTSEDAGR